eukprot:2048620-Pyramimonas_sp.AAC.1
MLIQIAVRLLRQDNSMFSASRGPRWAPGPSKNDSGWETGPGEWVETSGDAVPKKITTSDLWGRDRVVKKIRTEVSRRSRPQEALARPRGRQETTQDEEPVLGKGSL